jgi:hypothetical protein
VTVTFSPTVVQAYSGTITVASDKTSGTNTVSISGSGTAVPTRVLVLLGNLTFGNVTVNSTATNRLTISNSGNSPLTVSNVTYPTNFTGNWSGSANAIYPGGWTNVIVTFRPTSITNYSGLVSIFSDRTSGTNTITASGQGAAQSSSYATWQVNKFSTSDIGTGLTTMSTDFDGDGLPNLLEYAFATDPKTPDPSPVATGLNTNNLWISFPCNSSYADITYTIQSSTNLDSSSWSDIAKSSGGAATVPIGSLSAVSDSGAGLRTVTVTDSTPISTGGRRFLRVKVTSP